MDDQLGDDFNFFADVLDDMENNPDNDASEKTSETSSMASAKISEREIFSLNILFILIL